jgi:hypothetical protein
MRKKTRTSREVKPTEKRLTVLLRDNLHVLGGVTRSCLRHALQYFPPKMSKVYFALSVTAAANTGEIKAVTEHKELRDQRSDSGKDYLSCRKT